MSGVLLSLITYIVAGLQQRFTIVGDKRRVAAMTQLLALSRRQGETINGTLAQYVVVCQKQPAKGTLLRVGEMCALQPLPAYNVTSQQMLQVQQPVQGRLPHDAGEFAQLTQATYRSHLGALTQQLGSAAKLKPAGKTWGVFFRYYLRLLAECRGAPSKWWSHVTRCSSRCPWLGQLAS